MSPARREVVEETGITQGLLRNLQWTQVYEILPAFGKKYAPGVTRNLEHAFALKLLRRESVTLSRDASMSNIDGRRPRRRMATVSSEYQSHHHRAVATLTAVTIPPP